MGEIVSFPKKRRKRLRPNRREGRAPAELTIFPVLQSAKREFLDELVLMVASEQVGISECLRQLYDANYWPIPKGVLQREFSRVGWYLYNRANAVRRLCGEDDLEPPVPSRRSRSTGPGLPPAA